MSGNVDNLLAGVPRAYIGPVGEPTPELNALVGVTIGEPGGNWSPMGFTMEDWNFNYAPEYEAVYVNETSGPVDHNLIRENPVLSLQLAENDIATWARAIAAASVTVVAAGAAQAGQVKMGIGDGVKQKVSILLIGKAAGETAGDRAILIHKCLPTNDASTTFARGHRARPVEFTVEADMTKPAGSRLVEVWDILAPATT